MTIDSVVYNGDTRSLKQAVGTYASVLGDYTPNVALSVNYFSDLTQTEQVANAIHEALHIEVKMDDPGLKGWLQTLGFKHTDVHGSHSITEWISKGCH